MTRPGARRDAVSRQRMRSLEKTRSGRRRSNCSRSPRIWRRPFGVRGVSSVPAYRPSRPRTDSPWRTRIRRKRGEDGEIGAADIERRRKKLESAPCLLRFRPTAHSNPERRLCLRRQVFWLPDLMSRVFPGSLPVTSALRQFRLQRRDRPRFSRGSLLGPRGHLCLAHHNFPLPPVKRMGGFACTRLAPNWNQEGSSP